MIHSAKQTPLWRALVLGLLSFTPLGFSAEEHPYGALKNSVAAVAGSSWESFSTAYYEAEASNKSQNCQISNQRMPYIGTGYVQMGGAGAFLEWNNICVKAKGKYTLLIKYANGSRTPLACDLMVNGIPAKQMLFDPDKGDLSNGHGGGPYCAGGPWGSYWNARAAIDLNEGYNTVKLTSVTGTVGPVIDNIAVSSGGLSVPSGKIFDVRQYGARPNDPSFDNTHAIQAAIEACTPGGSVVLTDGIYMSGRICLKSDMTLWIAENASLKAIQNNDVFPILRPAASANPSVWRSLVYSDGASNLTITGGGRIDGSGGAPIWNGRKVNENQRPTPVYLFNGKDIVIRNIDIVHSAMWTLVPEECDRLIIDGINIDCRNEVGGAPTENCDGMDIDDCHDVSITNCALLTEDDIICLKSHSTKGVENLIVRNITGNSTNDNFIKFGTSSYQSFKNLRFEDVSARGNRWLRKSGSLTGLSLATVDGADIENVLFNRVQLSGFSTPLFILNGAGKRSRRPKGLPRRIGKVTNITINDMIARDTTSNLGSSIMGTDFQGVHYVTNVTLRNVDVEFHGGLDTIPVVPEEYRGNYPESSLFGPLPAYGYFIRHAKDIHFINCKQTVSPEDARKPIVEFDTTGIQIQ